MSGDLWRALDVRGYEFARFLLSLLWQSSILLLGVAALAFLLRRQPARVRHALWLVGLLCVPLLPLISWAGSKAGTPQRQVAVIPHYRAQFAPMSEPAYPVPPTRAAEAPDETSRALPRSLERQSPIPTPHVEPRAAASAPLQPKPRARIYPWAWGIAVYTAMMAALLAWVLIGWLQIRRRLRSGRVLNDARIAGILSSAQEQAGVHACVAVVESEAHPVPLTFGTFLPVIIAPKGLLASLSDEEVRVLLLHELAHIRRRDAPTLMLVSLLRAVFFFQPLAWIATRRISILSEQAADDIVVEVTEQPVAYAKTLARLAEELPRRAVGIELSAGFIFSRGAFLSRVKAILADRARVRKLSRWALVATVTAVLVIIGIACAVSVGEKPSAPVESATAQRKEGQRARENSAQLPNATDADLAALKNVEEITSLRITDGNVTDAAMARVEKMTNLEQLLLANCSNLTDAALAHLRPLHNLRRLYIYAVNITDAGLANLRDLTQLETLNLNWCSRITDAGLSNFVSMRNLEGIGLAGTQITDAGLKQLTAFPRLSLLCLQDTHITDAGLKQLAAFPRLSFLMLQNRQITDDGTSCLAGINSLRTLNLGQCQLTDAGLERLSGLKDLVDLSLDGTQITGAGLSFLKDMRRLMCLRLSGCKGITDAGLSNLKGMGDLNTLYLDNTNVTDAGLENLKGLHRLANLALGQTRIGDAGIAHLKGLVALQMLRLDNSQVTDVGLASLESMRQLRNLYLNSCRITDAAVACLKNMGSLQAIDLRGDPISNAALAELKAALPRAEILVALESEQSNRAPATASSPQAQGTEVRLEDATDADLAALKNVEEITSLSINSPNVTDAGLAPLEKMTNLERLQLDRCDNLTDAAMTHLRPLHNLRHLYIWIANITGAGLANLKDLTQLETLNLNSCSRITDADLSNFVAMRNLEDIDLGGTQITDAGLKQLAALPRLSHLGLQNTRITDDGMSCLAGMKSLRSLDVGRTQLTDAGLERLSSLKELMQLSLYGTQITDAGLSVTKDMRRLALLNLWGCKGITDTGLTNLKGMRNLEALYLDDTNVTDAGLQNLEGLYRLAYLGLGQTRIGDAGIAHLKGLVALQMLRLENSQVTDAGLASLTDLTQLRLLYLNSCRITDAAVACLKNMRSLQTIDLRGVSISNAALSDLKAALPKTQILVAPETQNQAPPVQSEQSNRAPATGPSPQAQGSDVRLEDATDADLAALKNPERITSLLINSRKVTDDGLSCLKKMSNLQQAWLYCNNLTDATLVHLAGLHKLNFLYIAATHITDKGLSDLKGLTQLRYLDLLWGCSHITDSGLSALKDLTQLQDLNLQGCSQITDAGVACLAGMPELNSIGLSKSQVTDAGLAKFEGRTNLTWLDLSDTGIGDAGLAHFRNCSQMGVMVLDRCPNVTDAGLAYLKGMRSLYKLFLGNTRVSGAGMANLKDMAEMDSLFLKGTDISDTGLTNLENMRKLSVLSLAQCPKLTDAGLKNLAELSNLSNLDLSGCPQITDAGLDCLKTLKQLRRLGLRGTKATAAGIARLKAALPQAVVESGEMPIQPPPQPQAPAAVTKALAAEWPDADIRAVNQMGNYPGWEPKKIWRAMLLPKADARGSGYFFVALTDAGQVIRVVKNFEGAQAAASMPQAVADAMAATIAGAKCDMGARIELRADRTLAKLAKRDVRFLLQVTGSDAMAELSISEDGQDVKIQWKAPLEVFKTIKGALGDAPTLIRPMMVPVSSHSGWSAMGRTPGGQSNITVSITEQGDIASIMTQFFPQRGQKTAPEGIPKAVAAVAAASPKVGNDFETYVKTEKRLDDNLAKLPQPVVTYQIATPTAQTFVTESGVVTKIVTHLNGTGDVPAAVSATVKAVFPGATIGRGERDEERADDKTLRPLAKPAVTYDFQVGETGNIGVSEAGAVAHIGRALTVADIPQVVAKAAAQAVPGGVISTAYCNENRLDETLTPLPKPKLTYHIHIDQGDTGVVLILDEDGQITRKQTTPTWGLPAM